MRGLQHARLGAKASAFALALLLFPQCSLPVAGAPVGRRQGLGGHRAYASLSPEEDVEDTPQEIRRRAWGTGQWPPPGLPLRPPPGASSAPPWDVRLEGPLILALAAVGVGLSCSRWSPVRQGKGWKTGMHLHALVAAISWRHLHRRALTLHMVRVALPALFLLLVHRLRAVLVRQLWQKDFDEFFALHGGSPEAILDALVEYALTAAMIYAVMMSMVFFVWHLSSEAESGFRRLLHVSGLSRLAYMLATAGVDGVLMAVLGLLVMLTIAGCVLEVRLVLWTSPVLLLVTSTLLSLSAVLTGYLLQMICPTARLAASVAQFVMVAVTFSAPFTVLSKVVPEPGEQAWKAILIPAYPAYRALFELAAACYNGRCLTLSDVMSAAAHGNWASPRVMIFGTSSSSELSPPESLLSFAFLVSFQLVVGCCIVLLLDRRHYPDLFDASAQAALTMDQGAILEVQDLVHWYGWRLGISNQAPTSRVLDGVSFTVAPGAMLGLLGPNGAGKTTVIRCITGEERPCAGGVAIRPDAVAAAGGTCGAYIGLCPQETILNNDLTVSENLLFFACVRGAAGEEALRYLEQLLEATRLMEKRDTLPTALSGGMRRRLAVGCAMIASPAVAVLDEPTTGLDPMSRRGIWGTIHEIRAAGGCCLLTTHMLEEAEMLCSHIVVLAKGRKVAEGSVQQLKDRWGTGYLLFVDCLPGQEDSVIQFLAGLLHEVDREPIRGAVHGQMTFRFSQSEEALGHLIIAIARGKAQHGIRHWGISQASLEDAYVRIIQQDAPGT